MIFDLAPSGAHDPATAAELAANPAALRWAAACAWVPGSGYCRSQPCAADCLFRPQREAEAVIIAGLRRQRRQPGRRHRISKT